MNAHLAPVSDAAHEYHRIDSCVVLQPRTSHRRLRDETTHEGAKFMDKRFLGAWLIASCATGAVAQTEEAWKTYVNSRYGYSLCYPASLFRAGAEPDAHDGVTFEGPPGATLIVHGSYNATSDSLASVAANELSAVAGRPITSPITQPKVTGRWRPELQATELSSLVRSLRETLWRDLRSRIR